MSIEGQPNTILTVYSPFAWIEDTTGSFITFPTAQNSPITFPNSIACSTLNEASAGTGIYVNTDLNMAANKIIYTDLISPNSATGLNIGTGLGTVINIGTTTTRTTDINIGSNPSAIVGETTGSVNIMNGAGRQEGSFNVLTNTTNRGVINLGHIGSTSTINIYSLLDVALRIGYTASTYTNEDRYIGSSKSMNYVNAGFTALSGNLYVFGNIATVLATGTYQVNLKVSLASTNVINPYLKVGLYTKGGATAWVDGAILTGGTLTDACYWVGKAHAPALNDLFTIQVSGIATFTAKQQVCVGLGYNTGTGQLSGGSILSLVRIG